MRPDLTSDKRTLADIMPAATSVWGLKLLVYEALNYKSMRPDLTSDKRTLADIMPAVKPRFRDIIGRYEAFSY
jgi:hypothetical protein